MDFFLTLQNVSVLFLLILIGYIVGRLGIVSEGGQRELTALILNVTMPATIILSMQVPFTMEKLNQAIWLSLIMIGCYLFMVLFSSLAVRLFPKLSVGRKDILQAGMILSNTSFMGYPIVLALLGEGALFYAVICGSFIFEIFAWTYGTFLIGRNAGGGGVSLKRAVLNPGVLSIGVGVILFLTGLTIPEPINSTMELLSKATSPMAMMMVGMILSRTKLSEALGDRNIYIASGFKLLVHPLLILFALRALGFSDVFITVPIILLSMPTAAYVAMFSASLDNDEAYAGQLVFVSSLLSLITIPIVTSLL